MGTRGISAESLPRVRRFQEEQGDTRIASTSPSVSFPLRVLLRHAADIRQWEDDVREALQASRELLETRRTPFEDPAESILLPLRRSQQ